MSGDLSRNRQDARSTAVPVIAALILGVLPDPARAVEPTAISVRLQVERGPYYVGQTIPLPLVANEAGEGLSWIPPTISGGDLIGVRTVGETVLYRLVPRRAGRLTVGPFRVRDGLRSGSSRPATIAVENPPVAGRPSAFLGGVSRFEVEARADPFLLRLGQTFSYSIRVTGPGAYGTIHPPDLERVARCPLAPRVTRLATETVAEPPSRTFRYELRPTRDGGVVLPPVAVAAFDPTLGRYVTKVTAGLPVQVVQVRTFDSGTLILPDDPSPSSVASERLPWTVIAAVASLLFAVAGLSLVSARLVRRGRPDRAARRVLERAVRRLGNYREVSTLGRELTEALADYLALTIGRPRGALTPEEAKTGVTQATGTPALGTRAAGFVALCDRARFASVTVRTEELKNEAKVLFEEMRRGAGQRDQERQ